MASSDSITYIANHLFLPPGLPQQEDREVDSQNSLLSHVVESAATFYQNINRAEVDQHVRQCWDTLHRMLLSVQNVRQGSLLDLQSLRDVVENMRIGGASSFFHISIWNST